MSALLLALSAFCFLFSALPVRAVTFTNSARIEITDTTAGLSWSTSNPGLTVQCWLKIAVPSGVSLTEDMTLLVNRCSGSESDAHAYQIRYSVYTGNLEFTTKGSSGGYTNTLVEKPYLERWYHVAVVRQAAAFTAYVDGRQVFSASPSVGDARSTDGVSVGGWGSGKWFYGEMQELAIYQTPLSQDFIVQNMYADQPAIPELKGYFKLGYSTNSADNLKNFAPAPVPTGTDSGVKQGSGNLEFEEANEAGEQSAFDSRKNGGMDAVAPLSGSFSWEQVAFARPTPGVAFDLRFGYGSANAYGGFKLGGTDPYSAGALGSGWRHTFETRMIPAQTFSPLADTDTLGLLMWNGSIVAWDLDYGTGEYRTRDKEYRGELLVTTTNYQWTTPERLVYVFKRPDSGAAVMRGRLLSVRDFNTNSVQVRWNETSGMITQIVDTAGGRYNFGYSGNLLTNLSFESWSVKFAYDATNRLTSKSITNTSGLYTNLNTTWQFQYNTNGLLEQIVDPRGNTNSFVRYDQYGRKTNQVDALGRATADAHTAFPASGRSRTPTPATFAWIETYDRKGRMSGAAGPAGEHHQLHLRRFWQSHLHHRAARI